ncbi:glycosyltransferase family 2 protein [Flavobacterium sp. XN-5]|nr:glycosyltransferase family 2 protein [Flavobacterium sp. XN-5]
MPKIAVLLTCHNRKEKTLQCLDALYAQQGLDADFNIEVFLVDDGSTDGTAEAIASQFPKVTIIAGDGNLYWNRGMHLAWQTAAATNDFDYYLWLNDDTFLEMNALEVLLSKTQRNSIVCGTTKSSFASRVTYGGYSNSQKGLLVPNGKFQECDYFNGNCVLVSKAAYDIVGNLDPVFHHALGDFDYSLRAKKLGVTLYIGPDFIGACESHTELPKWRSPEVNVLKRIKSLYTATNGCYPPHFFVFDKRHNGLLVASFHFLTINLRALMPFLWTIKSK